MSAPELKNKKLSLIKLSSSAGKIVSNGDLKNDIVTLLSGLSNLQELKNSKLSTVVKYVCELIENSSYKAKTDALKLDKKQLALDAIIQTFPDLNNEADIKRLSDLIDFCVESGLVKAIPQSTIIAKSGLSWLKKKVL